MVVPGLALRLVELIQPATAADGAWVENPPLLLGQVGRDITRAESDQLLVLSSVHSLDGFIFGDEVQESPYWGGVSWETPVREPAITATSCAGSSSEHCCC